MSAVEAIFEALGDPVRRGILGIVSSGELTAGAVVEAVRERVPISQPAVSQHLKVLREAGLVTVRAEGTRRLYAVDPDGVERARVWLARLTHPIERFAQPLDALATEVARGKRDRREPDAKRERSSGELPDRVRPERSREARDREPAEGAGDRERPRRLG